MSQTYSAALSVHSTGDVTAQRSAVQLIALVGCGLFHWSARLLPPKSIARTGLCSRVRSPQTMSLDNDHLIKSSIDHSVDDIILSQRSQTSIEQLEMRRLGLPISFGSSKKRSSGKRGGRRQHAEFVQDDRNYNLDYNDTLIDYGEGVLMDVIEGEESQELVDELSSFSDGAVEEVPSIKMANDCFDFIDMNKLKISSDNELSNEFSKRLHPDDELTGSEVSKEDLKPSKKKKKSKKQKDTFSYWRQRFVLFSRFSEGIKLDRESWYSVTPEPIARHIACRVERALITQYQSSPCENKFIILDGFCGAGGNTIQFALMTTTALVYAVDIDPHKIELARHNATIYGCVDKIQFIVADFFEVIQSDRLPRSLVDVCFLSPPWGGPDYNKYPSYSLKQMTPNGFEIARLVATRVTKNISFLLPRNFDMNELEPLSRIVYEHNPEQAKIKVEIEENLLYKKVKTMTAYFSDLVHTPKPSQPMVEMAPDDQNDLEDEEEEEEE